MKTTQLNWIRQRLLRYGRIRRNECLRRLISRLAARISDLKAEGLEIEGRIVKTRNGRDYEYILKV